MSKRLRSLAILGVATLITVTTVSFGYFYFGGDIQTDTHEAVNKFKVDDIYENYKSIAEDEGTIDLDDQRYHIYIYPSAEYLQIYNNYLNAVEERLNASYPNTAPTEKQVNAAKKDQNAYSLSLINQAMPGEALQAPTYTNLYRPAPETFNGSLRVSYKDDGDIVRDPKKPDEPLLTIEDPIPINPSYLHSDFKDQAKFDDFANKTYTSASNKPSFSLLSKSPENRPYIADMYVQYLNENYTKMYNAGNLWYMNQIVLSFIRGPGRWKDDPKPFYSSLKGSSLILEGDADDTYYKNFRITGDYFHHFTDFENWFRNAYWDPDICEHWDIKNEPDEWKYYRIDGSAGYQRNIYKIYRYYALNYDPKGYRTYGAPGDKSFTETYQKQSASNPGIVEKYIDNFRDMDTSRHIDGGKDYDYTEPLHKYEWNDGAQDGGMPLFADDRFGAWQYRSLDQGRFSPIHLKVDNNITPQVFSKAYGTLICSMNDGNKRPWFQNTFDNFVFAKTDGIDTSIKGEYKFRKSFPLKSEDYKFMQYKDEDGNPLPIEVQTRDLMSSCDMDNIFDITKPLSEYADENNVIRLFPVFSSGKGYYSKGYKRNHTSDKDVDDVSRGLGGKDQISFKISHSIQFPGKPEPSIKSFDKNPAYIKRNPLAPDFYPFGKKTDPNDQDVNKGKHFSIYCGYLSSVPINIYTLKTRIQVSLHMSNGPGGWGGKKPQPYDLDFNTPEDLKYIQGSGYYNIYIFIGNSGHYVTEFTPDQIPNDSSSSPSVHKTPRLDKYFDTSIKQETNYLDAFPQLKDKRLIHVPCERGVADYYDENTQSPVAKNNYGGNHINQRPIYMMLEKAVEPKLFLNTDSRHHNLQEIDELAIKNHDIAPTGYRFTRPTFAINDSNQVEQVYKGQEPGEAMKNKNLYYIFKNVDFTDVDNNDFFLRFGHMFDKTVRIANEAQYKNVYITKTSYPIDSVPKLPTLDELTSKNSNYARFWPAFGPGGKGNFFTLNTKQVEYNGEVVNRQYMSLNDDQQRGVYDVIFVKRDPVPGVSEDPNLVEFDMYTYRHTNIFVKLFRNDLTEYGSGDPNNISSTSAQFIQHRNAAGLLFNKQCFIGDILDNGERSDIHAPNETGLNIDEIIRANIQAWHDEEAKKYNSSDPNAAPPIDFSNLVIRDHVTGAPVIWYNPIKGQKALRKGKVDPLDGTQFEIFYDPNFVILKNHILYISTKGKL